MDILRSHIQQVLQKPGKFVLMVRHAESVCNLAGTLSGWTDNRLTDYGKKQSQELYSVWHSYLPQFRGIFASDLKRTIETTSISTLHAWPFTTDERLREIYFGDEEGEHYDTLPQDRRDLINSPKYIAPNGEGWEQVGKRVLDFYSEKISQDGVHLCVSHGGLICSLTY